MRPVADEFEVTQAFGSYATVGVAADWNGTEVQQLVAVYGNYQPYGHAGCDIGCPVGTPVHAIADGTVLWSDWGTNLPGDENDWGYRQRWYLYKTFPGIVTVIQHDGWIGVYAHLSEAWLNPGDTVTEGQLIGKSGNTKAPGQTLGAHLHVEALIDLSYSTGNGLIYGRTDPTSFFGSGALAPAGEIIQEEEVTQDQIDEIIHRVNLFAQKNAQDVAAVVIAEVRAQTKFNSDRVLDALKQIPQIDNALIDELKAKLAEGAEESVEQIKAKLNALTVTLASTEATHG